YQRGVRIGEPGRCAIERDYQRDRRRQCRACGEAQACADGAEVMGDTIVVAAGCSAAVVRRSCRSRDRRGQPRGVEMDVAGRQRKLQREREQPDPCSEAPIAPDPGHARTACAGEDTMEAGGSEPAALELTPLTIAIIPERAVFATGATPLQRLE